MGNADISRRGFIGGTGFIAGAMGMSSLGLSGLVHAYGEEAADAEEDNISAIEPVTPPDTWDYETDVLVVGAGGAGGGASVTALEAGAKVIVMERSNIWGGNAQFSLVWGLTPDIPAEDVYAYEMTEPTIYAQNNSALIKKISKESIDNLNWMIEHGEGYMVYVNDKDVVGYDPGVVFCPCPANYVEPENPTTEQKAWYQWFPYNGRGFTNTMRMSAEKLGVQMLYSTRATALVMDGDTVVGVKGIQEDGTEIYVKASATILATGGYSANFDMIKHYATEETYRGESKYCGTPLALGDGIRMAQGAGAWISNMDFIEAWDGGVYDPKHMGTSAFYCVANQMNRQASLSVNILGKRFMNEGAETISAYSNQAALKNGQPYATCFTILDSTMVTLDDIVDKFHPLECEIPVPWWDEEFEDELADGIIMKADTIEELAGLMGVDAATLGETVDRYNEMCDAGFDDDFWKDASRLWPLNTPPYYATKGVGGSTWCTYGGIKYDDCMHAIRPDGTTISGLFCAGETATLLACNNRIYPSGRIAGRTAAEEALA